MPQTGPSSASGAGVGGPAREADHRLVAPRRRVDALGVFLRQPAEDLDLAPGQPEARGVRVAHRPIDPFGRDRSRDIVLRSLDDRLQGLLEVGIGALDVRAVPHEVFGRNGHGDSSFSVIRGSYPRITIQWRAGDRRRGGLAGLSWPLRRAASGKRA